MPTSSRFRTLVLLDSRVGLGGAGACDGTGVGTGVTLVSSVSVEELGMVLIVKNESVLVLSLSFFEVALLSST